MVEATRRRVSSIPDHLGQLDGIAIPLLEADRSDDPIGSEFNRLSARWPHNDPVDSGAPGHLDRNPTEAEGDDDARGKPRIDITQGANRVDPGSLRNIFVR
jgi:hypothetical protein